MDLITLLVGIAALILALTALFYAVAQHKGTVGIDSLKDVLGSLREAIKGVMSDKDVMDSLFDRLDGYADRAYHAIQQRYHNGEIAAEDRKDSALTLVCEFAALDGIELGTKELGMASELIEAKCDAMGHAAPEAGTELQA